MKQHTYITKLEPKSKQLFTAFHRSVLYISDVDRWKLQEHD